MKEFVTAVEAADATPQEKEEGLPFMLDGRECHAFKPNTAQLAVLMAQTGRHASQQSTIAGIINFLMASMADEDAGWLAERLLDRNDPFNLERVEEIMYWLLEEWTGRPTEPLSVSSE